MNLISFVTEEIITVKYIVSYSLFIFIIENKKKKQEKEADNNFLLFPQ